MSVNGSIGIVIVCALGPSDEADVDLVVLHRRIEELLDDRPEAMDLVDEQDVAGAQIGERADQVARLLQRRPRARADVDAELARDQLGERRLAESRRAEEERVVERLAPGERRVDVDAEALLDLLLADELREPLRPQRQLDDGLVGQDFRCRDLGAGHDFARCGGETGNESYAEERPKSKTLRHRQPTIPVLTFRSRVSRLASRR